MLNANIDSQEILIENNGFEELEGQEIIIDVWGCSKAGTSYDPTNLDLETYSFLFMNLTLFDCANQIITGQTEH